MLALIAGTGALPGVIADRLSTRGQPFVICEMEGVDADVPLTLPRLSFRLETLGSFLVDIVGMGVTTVCMAGAVHRPMIVPDKIDEATKPLVPRLLAALGQGDDGALRTIISIIEEAGLQVVGAHDLVPDLLPGAGVHTTRAPDQDQRIDALVGEEAVAQMGQLDLGQACVVRAGAVLVREDERGTDAMLADLAPEPRRPMSGDPLNFVLDQAADLIGEAADWLSGSDRTDLPAAGALLFKAPKPRQDRRADLPVIGLQTVAGAIAAGLAGIVIEADGVMVIDLPDVVAALNDAGMFLWVRPRGGK